MAENGWERAEGLRLILGSGLGYLKGEKTLQAVAAGTMTAEDLQKLISRMMETESRLAVLHFRAFELERANQNWELSTGAIQNESVGLRELAWRLREEIAALKAENERLRVQMTAQETSAKPQTPAPELHVHGEYSWLRLFRRNSPKEMSAK
jgi:hypothetical protein